MSKKVDCQLSQFPKHLVEEAMNELIKQRIKHALASDKLEETIDAMLEKELLACVKKEGKALVEKAFEKEKKNMIQGCINEMVDNGFSEEVQEEMDRIAEEAVLARFKKV